MGELSYCMPSHTYRAEQRRVPGYPMGHHLLCSVLIERWNVLTICGVGHVLSTPSICLIMALNLLLNCVLPMSTKHNTCTFKR